ncbi:MAG: helix-turn-helix domain-containing protein, partial [Lachnospiraceae bacterium]
KYRKEAGLTQEEMANRLGVTTPAVNKWENGNSKPDIELLAPIARLLHISLDTLMSFHEELSPSEIGAIVREMDNMFNTDGFEKVFEWASEKIKEYPNCNMLIWQAAVILDARRLTDDCTDSEKYDEQINAWYEIALKDENEEIKRHAADSLFGFYLRKKEYAKAEEYLQYFSDNDPMKKIYQGRLFKEKGEKENAYKAFESILFSGYQTLNFTFSLMTAMALEEGDNRKARYFAEKMGAIAGIFEMGKYHECSPMLEVVCAEKNVAGTYQVVEQLLKSVDSLCDFPKSRLFQHMKFSGPDSSFVEGLKEKLMEGFRDEKSFGYMRGDKAWEELINDKTH